MKRLRHLGSAVGWGTAVLMGASAWKLAAEVVEHERVARLRSMREQAEDGAVRQDYLPPSSCRDWGVTLANLGTALVRDGFENQAPYLFTASGELLEAADRGGVS